MQPTRLVVLASGTGSRLRSEASPKPLVELGGISLVERALAGARQAGFDEVVVVTGHRAEATPAAAHPPKRVTEKRHQRSVQARPRSDP